MLIVCGNVSVLLNLTAVTTVRVSAACVSCVCQRRVSAACVSCVCQLRVSAACVHIKLKLNCSTYVDLAGYNVNIYNERVSL
jgi:hypothetical protein